MSGTDQQFQLALSEKDELIAALTEQLELAAEQLDRYQRNGEQPRHQSQFGSNPIAGPVGENLQNFLTEWNDLQPSTMLTRMESMLLQIKKTIESGELVTKSREDSYRREEPPAPAYIPQPTQSHNEPAKAEDEEAAPTAPVDFWAQMKSSLMAKEEGYVPDKSDSYKPVAPKPAVVYTPAPQSKSQPERQASGLHEEPFDFRSKRIDEGPDAPADIDLANASPEELVSGVEERDEYISYLHDRLRKAEEHEHFKLPTDWEIFGNYPGDVRVKLEFLEAQLNSVLRTSEIQLSMERARIGRYEARVQHLQTQIEKQARKMELDIRGLVNERPDAPSSSKSQQSAKPPENDKKGWWGKK
jgi:hypothetical protein